MLQRFGYSQYESKVYETLATSEQAMDATSIVKYSGVPKAKIYEVLSRLAEKGIILDAISGKKRTYAALPIQVVIDKLTREFEQDITQLRASVVRRNYGDDQVWSLKSQSSIAAYCKEMIAGAQQSIVVSMWADEFAGYANTFEQKEQVGVQVEALVIGTDSVDVELSKLHFLTPAEGTAHMERFTLVVIDGKQVLFAGMEDGSWHAIRTQAQPFVKFFTEFFYHDVALAKISLKYVDELLQDDEMRSLLLRLRY
ncbi:TrmB family transcriptional regulator [Paenibacillus arenosi]|uniref:TrmB family transcriptional regulator n=1 Tax=Paenibacillus arenosi TaxID=2774142 RepID=A0ABR9AZZ1_9BACL|nr:TrmB family transcriptional regulator [Paenibacillus arenosi]MBD8499653.1 TrmB family transcriptional regulator [Paenibacillus arenosi]